jgi:predicted nucleotidyltransferase
MATSIDFYLRNLASSYYLKNNSIEVEKISSSISNLLSNLDKELGILIKRRFIFGSYDRDTILPRSIDKYSDVDIMVVFNHTDYEREPETYRNWLKNFADKYYKDRYGSEVIKSHPTVTIRLNNIHYDLVPAKEITYVYSSPELYIPSKITGWQITDPNDVKNKLTTANTQYNNVVRPIIRLLKAWNCFNDYPYDSYKLELEITTMNFYGDTVQKGFFYAAGKLASSLSGADSQMRRAKVQSLVYNINEANNALERDDPETAKRWIHRILPTV